MTSLLLLALFGGILAVASPCVLPVLPFVLARTGRSARHDIAPFLVGLIVMFAAVGSIAGAGTLALASGTATRWVAPVILGASAIALLSPSVAQWFSRPFVRVGAKFLTSESNTSNLFVALGVGAATGLVWAPCAGPILALVLAGAATGELAPAQLPWVLLSFAGGSAFVFALILLLGDLMRTRMQSMWLRWHRKAELAIGAAALAAALLIISGNDARLFARVPTSPTAGVEQALVRELIPRGIHSAVTNALPDLGAMPSLEGGLGWINSEPISRESLQGKVSMIEIWTFACYNCLNALPHVKETAARYKDQGLITIGVHTPELPRERPRANVEAAVRKLGVTFPVVLDNNFVIWKAFRNQYWPSVYLVDRKGRIRFHHDGEGQYQELDAAVASLLAEKP